MEEISDDLSASVQELWKEYRQQSHLISSGECLESTRRKRSAAELVQYGRLGEGIIAIPFRLFRNVLSPLAMQKGFDLLQLD